MRLAPLALLFLPVSACHASADAAEPPACHAKATEVVVLTGQHRLVLCAEGKRVREFPVALGSGGLDKKKEGDARTPLGAYPLGKPRASADFHTFIPVGYPTPSQAKAGLTGSAVGIHGPPRSFRFAGVLTVKTDWTLGCIALPSDEDVDEVAKFVRQNAAGVRLER